MSKTIRHDLTYDAPAERVEAMLGDPGFREEVCRRQHAIEHDVSVEQQGAGMTVVVDQTWPAKGLPSFATKFVGDTINIVQTEHWSNGGRAEVDVTIPGKPGEVKGTVALTESGGTTTETVELTVKVGIPLVGGKIEGLIADMLVKSLTTENAVGRDYLSR